jgi:hypothetical protein
MIMTVTSMILKFILVIDQLVVRILEAIIVTGNGLLVV